VLDTTEMSGHSGYPPGSRQHEEAQVGSLVCIQLHIPPVPLLPSLAHAGLWSVQAFLAAHPLSDDQPQMSSWNGGITRQQLQWLRQELSAADAAGERVIVASHHQLGQGGARTTHLAWNFQEIQEVRGLAVECSIARSQMQRLQSVP
jgi:hypothetical protein